MMIRQDYKASNETRVALYCQFLENEGKDYEYISFILDDEKIVDYYFEDSDLLDSTYNVYFNDLELGKIYNAKVVGKLRDGYLFEVGNLWCYCIEIEENKPQSVLISESETPVIPVPSIIPIPNIEAVV